MVAVPGVPNDQVNSPVGFELPSVTVAVQVVVPLIVTLLGVQDTVVVVVAEVIVRESVLELDRKSDVAAKKAVIVVAPLPAVIPVTTTLQELTLQVCDEIETVPVPGVPEAQVNKPPGVALPAVTVAVHVVVSPTPTLFGEQVTTVVVAPRVIVKESMPWLAL